MKFHRSLFAIPVLLAAWAGVCSRGELPPEFPGIVVSAYDSSKVAPGYLFLASWSQQAGNGTYLMILNNDGTPVDGDKYRQLAETAGDFKVQANGLLSYAQTFFPLPYTGGWDVEHRLVDESLTQTVESIQMQNGYVAEFHDLQILPNGHALLFGYYLSEVDLSRFVPGGNPSALVSGGIIQELDAQRHAVFQWRSWDHYSFEEDTYGAGTATMFSKFHFNDLNLDMDGNLIAGTPSEIRKINRQSGQVMWTLGGPDNEFTPVGPGASVRHFGGHGTYRLKNGNFLMYANSDGTVSSEVHEYTLDEANKIATLVWSYTPETTIAGRFTGNAQRLPNGNTLICWGIPRGANGPICTEVTAQGEKVFELTFTDPSLQSYRAFRFPFPAASQKAEFTQAELSPESSYDFPDTGVQIDVLTGAGGYNLVTVTSEPYAPVRPSFLSSKAPAVVPARVTVSASGIDSITANISFDADHFGLAHPEDLTVYHRATPGSGLFVALNTAPYNPGTKQVRASLSQFGEFIFASPDLSDVAYPPILNRPENFRFQTNLITAPRKAEIGEIYAVNQELPITLSWSPRGLARFHELQIATDEDFGSPVVSLSFRTEAYYVWNNALPDMTYYWRARTMIENQGAFATGDWSSGAFQTVAPQVQVMAPNGHEGWRRGLRYFVHWNDNVAEDIVLDLYKGGVFLRNIATVAHTHAYRWEVDLDLEPGNDYSLRASSAADPALFDESDAPFSIDPPFFDLSTFTRFPDGRVQLEFSAPGATQATVLRSIDLSVWDEVQTVPVTDGRAVFIDEDAPDFPASFYLLRVP